jgi:hypothetical protein
MAIRCILLAAAGIVGSYAASITSFGAVPGVNTVDAARNNSIAIQRAFAAANGNPTDSEVLVPAGSNFYIMESYMPNLKGVTFRIEGTLTMNNNITAWPRVGPVNSVPLGALMFVNASGLHITGSGTIDGQGYDWWWWVFLLEGNHRPHMVVMIECQDVEIDGITARNSPQFHFDLRDMLNLHVHDMQVRVDVIAQRELLRSFGKLAAGDIPVFPLNTDGIDPSGRNVLIERVSIENFDDAVAVKPMNGGGRFSSCSSNMTIRDSTVSWGVGMTIGSVPPHLLTNCVKGILFQNITFNHPIKAVYVKTNPGDKGDGIISDIVYDTLTGDLPLWYPIWIGPQQQQQPGTKGTGCSFLYPIDPECPTQPRVPVSNIKLRNIHFTGGVTLPGVLLCNETVPCTGFEFTNVTNLGGWLVSKDYVCENVQGIQSNTNPSLPCLSSSSSLTAPQSLRKRSSWP